ncbi:MAG: hypothetical protein Q8Q30_01000 [Candidatus Woesebacteria bacterium]|nr:hypothetical protein [Candidatus Woesebacteria bacterium]
MKSKLVISLLAILVIVLAVFGYLMSSKELVSPKTFEREITKVETVSELDTVEDIEKDLTETDLTNLDAELDQIEAQIN